MRAPCPPVAVVGVSGIFPGSRTIAGFWRDIVEGRDLFTDVPSTHWLVEDYLDPDPTVPDKIYTARGAFLPSIDIDPVEFGIPPALFPSTDTCQLLALLAARDVLNDVTGNDLSKLKRERIAVILGVTAGQKLYVEMSNRLQRPVWVKGLRESGLPESEVQAICDRIAACYVPWTESTFPGSLGNVVAGRICNRFDLGGANCVTDAACASTLAAMSLALSQLYLGQADMVITGGADTFNDPSMYMCFSKTPALSAKGRCRPFDASADGTLLGEGIGFFALKRLDDAERDGDHIYAVIKALEGASDGRALSVYAPLAQGQARAVRRTYERAGISPATVELVEAHGTGTRAGDAAEFAGLKMVFEDAGRAEPQWCAIGSIKSQIGHLKAAAGAASMFKAVMSLNEGVLPPTIGVDTPNPKLDIPTSPFYLNTEARPWVRDAAHPRRAAVSSFGFGGSNWHMLLEEYRGNATKADRFRASPTELVLLGADTPEALITQCRDLAAECTPATTLRWLARRSQLAWTNGAHAARLSIVATSESDLAARLNQAADAIARAPKTAFTLPGGVSYTWQAQPGKVAFLFPGQGSQYAGMTADLSMAFEAARSVWDAADDTHIGDIKLHEVVFPKPVFTDEEKEAQAAQLKATEWTQPAVGAASLACRAVLNLVGLNADMMAGHSFGEISALAAAGALTDDDMLRIARRRGELMAEASGSGGAMLALTASRKDVDQLLTSWALPLLVVANDNAPQQVVLSGSVQSIDEAQRRAAAAGLGATRLPVAAAFHSPLIATATAPFAEALASATFATPRVPVYANATAQPYAGDAAAVRNQLGEQMRSAVRFVETLEAMYQAGARTFIEVGPSAVLTGLAQQCLAGRAASVIAMDRKDAHGVTSLWHALGQLAVAGVPLVFDRLWERVAVAAPITKKPAMTMTITGANYGKVYPPVNGAAGLPKPNPERTTPVASVASSLTAAPAAPARLRTRGDRIGATSADVSCCAFLIAVTDRGVCGAARHADPCVSRRRAFADGGTRGFPAHPWRESGAVPARDGVRVCELLRGTDWESDRCGDTGRRDGRRDDGPRRCRVDDDNSHGTPGSAAACQRRAAGGRCDDGRGRENGAAGAATRVVRARARRALGGDRNARGSVETVGAQGRRSGGLVAARCGLREDGISGGDALARHGTRGRPRHRFHQARRDPEHDAAARAGSTAGGRHRDGRPEDTRPDRRRDGRSRGAGRFCHSGRGRSRRGRYSCCSGHDRCRSAPYRNRR